jgi:hypothetical protein
MTVQSIEVPPSFYSEPERLIEAIQENKDTFE